MKILLHVGMPKCGSSALQKYLSGADFFSEIKKHKVAYVAIDNNGQIHIGDNLVRMASILPHAYMSSCAASEISNFDKSIKEKIKKEIACLSKQYEMLIFSNEGWGPHPDKFLDDIFLSDEALDVTVLAYIRPQVEWMNSAWWQWGAWTDVKFNKWVGKHKAQANWFDLLEKWRRKSWVKRVDARILDEDIIVDFINYVGLDVVAPIKTTVNRGLNASLLRVMQANRHLRPGPHNSESDFVFEKYLGHIPGRAPWILPFGWVENLIEFYRGSNLDLLRLLAVDQRQKMLGERKWWDSSCFLELKQAPLIKKPIYDKEMEFLLISSLDVILKLDQELRLLRGKVLNRNDI